MADNDKTLAIEFAAKLDRMQRDVDKGLGVVVRKLEKMENDGKKSFSKLEAHASASFGRMAKSILAIGAAYASISGGRALGGFIKNSLDAASAIQDVSNEANASTAYVQEMRYALSQAGGSAEDMDGALTRLNKSLGDFRTTGAGPAAESLKLLGLDADVMSGRFDRTDEAMDAVLRRLMEIPGAADRAAIASDLFGKAAGPRLAELLASGEEGLRKARERARELGLVLSDDMVRAADAAGDKLAELEQVIGVKLTEAVVKFAPEIEALADQLIEGLPAITNWVQRWAEWLGIIEKTPARIRETIAELEAMPDPGMWTDAQIPYLANQAKASELRAQLFGMAGAGGLKGGGSGSNVAGETIEVIGQRPTRSKVGAGADRLIEKAATSLADMIEYEAPSMRGIGQDIIDRALDAARAEMASGQEAQAIVDDEIRRQAADQKQAFTDALVYAFESGDLKGAALSFIGFFTRRMYEDLASSLYDALNAGLGGSGGGGGGGLFSMLGSLLDAVVGGGGGGGAAQGGFLSSFGGGRAAGGPVTAGVPYVVGEKRPELFVPDVNGRIIPEVPSLNGRGGASYHINVDARGSTMDSIPAIKAAVADLGRMIVQDRAALPETVRGVVADTRQRGISGRRW